MKALLINPYERSITEVEDLRWGYEAMLKALAGPGRDLASGMDSVSLSRRLRLWVDDNGYTIEGLPVFRIEGYDAPLCGMGLVLGLDAAGETVAPNLPVEALARVVTWTDEETTGEMTSGRQASPNVYVMGEAILRRVRS